MRLLDWCGQFPIFAGGDRGRDELGLVGWTQVLLEHAKLATEQGHCRDV